MCIFLLLLIDRERRPFGRPSHFLVAADMITMIGRANNSNIQVMCHAPSSSSSLSALFFLLTLLFQ